MKTWSLVFVLVCEFVAIEVETSVIGFLALALVLLDLMRLRRRWSFTMASTAAKTPEVLKYHMRTI